MQLSCRRRNSDGRSKLARAVPRANLKLDDNQLRVVEKRANFSVFKVGASALTLLKSAWTRYSARGRTASLVPSRHLGSAEQDLLSWQL